MRKVLSLALLAAGIVSANANDLLDCIEQADSNYHKAWVQACYSQEGGVNNFKGCLLPRYIADRLNSDHKEARDFCFQANAAGLTVR
jgi:hypothetical protein